MVYIDTVSEGLKDMRDAESCLAVYSNKEPYVKLIACTCANQPRNQSFERPWSRHLISAVCTLSGSSAGTLAPASERTG
jgi:hypothetical protein